MGFGGLGARGPELPLVQTFHAFRTKNLIFHGLPAIAPSLSRRTLNARYTLEYLAACPVARHRGALGGCLGGACRC